MGLIIVLTMRGRWKGEDFGAEKKGFCVHFDIACVDPND